MEFLTNSPQKPSRSG